MHRKALVLGGGAPDFTLMTGALLAFDEAGVEFDVISMAGGGSVVGLTYLAPKGLSRQDALRNSVNFGVSDAIYDLLPINYKIFNKAGLGADFFRKVLSWMPGYNLIMNQFTMTQAEKLWSDWIQAIWATLSPSNLSLLSKGLCAHAPFITEMVDFDKLKSVDINYYLNAYCLTTHKMEIFGKEEVDLDHFKAGLAFPFIYAPYHMNGKAYIEGAARDTFNFKSLVDREPDIKTIVVFDAIGIDGLIQKPTDLWSAYGQSIITPLVALARADLKLFELVHNVGPDRRRLLKVSFDIPEEYFPTALDWSSSNLNRLFKVGYEAGKKFVARHGRALDLD
jgi:NTE family protein